MRKYICINLKVFDDGSGRVCRLRRSLYDLKQVLHCWNFRFKFMRNNRMIVSSADPSLYMCQNGNMLIIAIYVDDGLIAV